ncbi:SHOCT domain-containing protein [Rhizobium sp. 18055]|uniref:SHOCT domain-containing protein n=1 Tax=Rhizobium sp. 18055 TaxID=2681403 RepID=UPI00135B4EFA|nr:SHOCT domain-containing protein [Rhizobium sp. 18055]
MRDPQEQSIIESLAHKHGFSSGVVEHLAMALIAGFANQAQFNHAELGGMGQWSSGGMVMVGDMFNNGLKHRVDMLCSDIAAYIRSGELSGPKMDRPYQSQSQGDGTSFFYQSSSHGSAWPQQLGQPSSTGAQNNLRYAFFPASRRLAIDVNGQITVYDTRDHSIGGFSQQQSGDQSLTFTSQHGLVRVSDLEIISDADETPTPKGAQEQPTGQSDPATLLAMAREDTNVFQVPVGADPDDIFTKIERLAGLHSKGILSDDEFTAKKTELLQRL